MAKAAFIKQSGMHPLSLLDRLTRNFMQEDFILYQEYRNLDLLLSRMESLSRRADGGKRPVFVLFAGGDCAFINTLKENSNLLQTISPGEKEQTLVVFQQEVLEGILGLSPREQAENVIYTEDLAAALQAVDDGQYSFVFLLNE
ncbi:hypothetical protein [Desulforamulus putei]|uniref:Uncharacterized protein n=1 Tax=Desulforamulus putei DSM 12395 TaxID=1121429 RepID=A0A1M5B2A2_9FIRM|nr:hypothetical protein [Desulforamulus putei]SHF36644.1 hypothetical protein SAMN02745133_02447 [Desulforamulus putei DSM 12395]